MENRFNSPRPSKSSTVLALVVSLGLCQLACSASVEDEEDSSACDPGSEPLYQILFSSNERGDSGIYLVSEEGTARQVLSDTGEPYPLGWSPDGSEILFVRYGDIFAISTCTREVRTISATDDDEVDAAWSPDGSKIALVAGAGRYDLFVVNADGTGRTNLTWGRAGYPEGDTNVGKIEWSPDGTRIAFSTNESAIYVIDADGENLEAVVASTGSDSDPHWSPDGSRIAFTSTRDGNGELYVIDIDAGGEPVRLTQDPAEDSGSSWSPDGERIAFVSFDFNTGSTSINVARADGTAVMRVLAGTDLGDIATWSPSGETIAFSRWSGTDENLYVMSSDGSDVRIIADSQFDEQTPRWSPVALPCGMCGLPN